LADVLPELLALYDNLEVKLKPLALVQKIAAAMTVVKENKVLCVYAIPLQRVAVVKLMQQLGRVYSSIKLDFLYKLLAGKSELSPNAIERILIEGVALKQLQLRINHSTRSIQFAASSSAAGTSVLDSQASALGSALNKVSHSISLSLGQETLEAQKAAARGAFLSKVAKAAESEFAESLDRKAQIERRKEGLERVQLERQKEAQRIKEEEEANRVVEEARRLELEEVERNNEKRKKAQEKMELLRNQKELERNGVIMEEAALAELDNTAIKALISDAQKVKLKANEKEEEEKTKKDRHLDHVTRALRIVGAEKVGPWVADQEAVDRLRYEAMLVEFFAKAKAKHGADLLEKKRLSHLQPLRGPFENDLVAAQRAAHDRYVSKVKAKMLKDRVEQVVARARRLQNEEAERVESEEEAERERAAAEVSVSH
jgi:translation initiation factor 3 subunit A